MKILCIGNSFSQDATRYLSRIGKAAGTGIKTVNLYIGGCPLKTHSFNILEDQPAYAFEFNGENTGIKVSIKMETTGRDPLYSPHRHQDIVVELKYPVKLIFPGSSFILASKPRKEGIRMIETEARMPVEKMYLSTDKQ